MEDLVRASEGRHCTGGNAPGRYTYDHLVVDLGVWVKYTGEPSKIGS